MNSISELLSSNLDRKDAKLQKQRKSLLHGEMPTWTNERRRKWKGVKTE